MIQPMAVAQQARDRAESAWLGVVEVRQDMMTLRQDFGNLRQDCAELEAEFGTLREDMAAASKLALSASNEASNFGWKLNVILTGIGSVLLMLVGLATWTVLRVDKFASDFEQKLDKLEQRSSTSQRVAKNERFTPAN